MEIIDVDPEDVLAAVCHSGQLRFYAAYLPMWIMNYESYSPGCNPNKPDYEVGSRRWMPDDYVFRGGLYVVDDGNALEFCKYLRSYELSIPDVKAVVQSHLARLGSRLVVLIDFDRRVFVDGTFGDELCRFVPPGWDCFEDSPEAYLPADIDIWPDTPKSPHRAKRRGEDPEAEAAAAEVVVALLGNIRAERASDGTDYTDKPASSG